MAPLRIPPRLAAAFVGLGVLLRASGPSSAEQNPLLGLLGDAFQVQADRLDIDVGAGQATLTGNVSLTRGELKVSCAHIDLKFDQAPHVTWVRGSGGVSADVRGVHAEGPEVEFDIAKHLLELRGGVRVSRGQGWLQAEQATIDTRTGRLTLTQVKGAIPVPPRSP